MPPEVPIRMMVTSEQRAWYSSLMSSCSMMAMDGTPMPCWDGRDPGQGLRPIRTATPDTKPTPSAQWGPHPRNCYCTPLLHHRSLLIPHTGMPVKRFHRQGHRASILSPGVLRQSQGSHTRRGSRNAHSCGRRVHCALWTFRVGHLNGIRGNGR